MAEDSKKEEKFSQAAHLEFAVREIMASAHLRAFFRHFFSYTNSVPANSVFDQNPIQNAYNQGYQAAGLSVAEIFNSVEPQLIPALLMEELTDEEV